MNGYAVEISGFTKRYGRAGGTVAVDNIDLKVREGSFFGFIGPNGAGKTTTVSYIAGLIKKTAGTLRILGEEVRTQDHEYKRKTGFVLDRPFYIDKLTAREYLYFVGRLYGLDKETARARAEELVKFFDIGDRKKQIGAFSAGMKKKVSLAAAMINDPRLLILDEPFEGIDPQSARQIKDQLVQMVDKGRTVLLTSHVLEIVEKLCDEVAIIDRGRIVFQGMMDEIREGAESRGGGKLSGLEDLFLSLVSPGNEPRGLSWL